MSSREVLSVGLVGLALFMAASPWLLGFSGNEWAAISACGIAALMMIAGIAGLMESGSFASAGALTLGAWSMVAPILLGFAQAGSAFLAHMAVGAAAMLLAAITADWRSQDPPEIRV